MSSDEVKLATFSDSSEDIGLLSEFRNRLPSRRVEPEKTSSLLDSEAASDPDWVRDFTPQKKSDFDQRAALLASLADDSDDDSVINLVSQEPNPKEHEATEDPAEPSKDNTQSRQPPPVSKRPRASVKPKSRLPLVVNPKLDDSLVLLQSVDGDLDLSGDVGAVGRVKLQEGSMFLDIKGVVYRTHINPCNTMCVVSVGEDDARITSVLDEVVTLECERNLFASDEVVVHGRLDESPDENSLSQSDGDGHELDARPPAKKKRVNDSNSRGRVSISEKRKTPAVQKTIAKAPRQEN